MQSSDDVLTVWLCFKSTDGNDLFITKCHGLKEAVETSVQMKREDYNLTRMYTYDQLLDMGIL